MCTVRSRLTQMLHHEIQEVRLPHRTDQSSSHRFRTVPIRTSATVRHRPILPEPVEEAMSQQIVSVRLLRELSVLTRVNLLVVNIYKLTKGWTSVRKDETKRVIAI